MGWFSAILHPGVVSKRGRRPAAVAAAQSGPARRQEDAQRHRQGRCRCAHRCIFWGFEVWKDCLLPQFFFSSFEVGRWLFFCQSPSIEMFGWLIIDTVSFLCFRVQVAQKVRGVVGRRFDGGGDQAPGQEMFGSLSRQLVKVEPNMDFMGVGSTSNIDHLKLNL